MQLLNQSEAARLLRLSTRTMERMRLQGIGPSYIKCGRSVRYRLDLIEEWVSRRVVSSTSDASLRQVNDRGGVRS